MMSSNGRDRPRLTVYQGGLDVDEVGSPEPRRVLFFPGAALRLATRSEAMNIFDNFIAPELYEKVFAYAYKKVGDNNAAQALLDVILEGLRDERMSLDGPTAFQDLCSAIDRLADVGEEE